MRRSKEIFKKSLMILMTMFLVFTFNAEESRAYTLNTEKIYYPLHFIAHQNFGETSMYHFNEALSEWNYYAGAQLMTRDRYSRHYSNSYPEYDGNSMIYRQGMVSQDILAEARVVYQVDNILEADININISKPFVNGGVPGGYDLWSVFLHEAGHCAGLGHTDDSNAVMYPYHMANSIARHLRADDVYGIFAKYR